MRLVTHAALITLAAQWVCTQTFAADPRLGTLFHTATERAALELRATTVETESPAEQAPPSAPISFRVDGMLWQGSRPVMLWVDRQPLASATPLGAAIRLPPDWQIHLAPGHVRLIDATGQTSQLHAGEHWPLTAPLLHLERVTARAR